MASPARAAARARAAEALSREELESGHAWAAATRRCALRLEHRLHRKNGAAKVLRAILRYQAAKVTVIDRRAIGVIARAARVSRRHARAMVTKLEDLGYVVRVRHAGTRLPGQRGWKTSGLVVPENLPNTDLLPPTARRRALGWDLADPRIQAALESRGVTVPSNPTLRARLEHLEARRAAEVAAEAEVAAKAVAKALTDVPAEVPTEAVWQVLTEVAARFEPVAAAEPEPVAELRSALPAVVAAVVGALAAGTENAQASIAGKALAPAVDKSTENRMDRAPIGFGFCDPDRNYLTPTPIAPTAVQKREEGAVAPIPHIAPSAASTVPEGPLPPPPPAAGERQCGPRLVPPSPATLVSAPRPPAVPPATRPTAMAGSRSEARPTLPEHLRGLHVPERQVLDWLVEHNPGMSRGKAWDCIKGYRQSAWWRLQRDARGESSGRPRAQGRRDAKAVAAKAVAADLDGDRQWAKAHRAWTDAAGDAEFFGWIMALRCAGWARHEGALVVRVTGPTDVLNRIAFRRAWLEDRAEAALGVPVVISWEPS